MRGSERRSQAIEKWLDERAKPAPRTLRVRIARAVEGVGGESSASIADISARAGQQLLAQLLTEGCAARSAAPDLLAADALVTYAFEALADDGATSACAIGERASSAMIAIARLGGDA